MSDTLSTIVDASVKWIFQEGLDLSTVTDSSKLEYSKTLADGVAIDTADKVWHDSRSIAGGANDDLDLTALTNTIFGSVVTINFVKIKGILIVNTSTTSGEELRLDSAVAASILTPFAASATSKIEIGADSCLLMTSNKDGWAVTATTADILRVHNPNAGAVVYKIAIWGTSA